MTQVTSKQRTNDHRPILKIAQKHHPSPRSHIISKQLIRSNRRIPPILIFVSTAYNITISTMSIKPTRTRSTGITVRIRHRRMTNTSINQRSTTATTTTTTANDHHHPSTIGANTCDVNHRNTSTAATSISGRNLQMLSRRRARVTSRTRLLYFLQEALDIVDDIHFDNEH